MNTKYYKNGYSIVASEVSPGEDWIEISKEEYDRIFAIEQEVAELKFELKKSDYKAIKHSEGLIPDEEYASVKEARERIRVRIRELEASI